jgi:hypothetical protein
MVGGAATGFVIGQNYGGGIIFYIDGTGQHELIASTSDQSVSAEWGCFFTLMGTGTTIGTGSQNTTNIIAGCAEPGIAAKVCRAYTGGGFTDWFLPSVDELNQMYYQRTVIGGFDTGALPWYWSSSEADFMFVYFQVFTDGTQAATDKQSALHIRAIRAF